MTPSPPSPARTEEAQVWIGRVPEAARLAGSDEALLDREERIRMAGLIRDEDRILYGSAHAGLRRIVSQRTGVDPCSLVFGRDHHGRPGIRKPAAATPCCFSLTHTAGLWAVIVAEGCDVGIDAEHLDRRTDVMEVAENTFSQTEVAWLRARTTMRERRALFFEYWTLKESLLKARGVGLSEPLDRFWFTHPLAGPIRIWFADPRSGDDLRSGDGAASVSSEVPSAPTQWRFELLAPTTDHRLAVAARALPGGGEIRVNWMAC